MAMTYMLYYVLLFMTNFHWPKFRQKAFSSLLGDNTAASLAFSDEIYPRRVVKAFYQE